MKDTVTLNTLIIDRARIEAAIRGVSLDLLLAVAVDRGLDDLEKERREAALS